MAEIEKRLVKQAFSSHAQHYESLAVVQKRVMERFLRLFMEKWPPPETLLDVGAGTGRLVKAISRKLPQISVTGVDLAYGMVSCAKRRLAGNDDVRLVCGDAESLPFRDGSFDMVVSTSTYQWLNPLSAPFAEVWRVLKPGGRFCFSLFGERTLFELKDSYGSALASLNKGNMDRTHHFSSRAEVLQSLDAASFAGIDVIAELEIENYPDVSSLLRAVNGIGAGSAARKAATGLSGRSVMLRMMEIYRERYGSVETVPATYQVFYGTGTKAA